MCENIVVLYQGSVAEAGSVERVIRDPRHPYTQLLVSSIPVTDRTRRWGEDEIPIPESSAGKVTNGCRFAPRCPYVMDECWTRIPPLFRVDEDRAASCFLHQASPVLPSEAIGGVFHRHASHAAAADATAVGDAVAAATAVTAPTPGLTPPPAPPAPPAAPAS